MTVDIFAFDRSSVRRIDQDGHLHVARAAISKAMVCPYYGDELPGSERLGLDGGRIYNLLRPPEELARAASTFDGKPLLDGVHRPQLAGDHAHELVAGSVGNVRWEPPYLTAELVVWPAGAIDAVQTGERRQLSASYRYDPVMVPGVFEGVRYDGRMTNIRGNHVILCETGRAGADVFVGDSITHMENPHLSQITFSSDYRPRRAATMADFQELRRAERECASLVPDAIAMDSADAIYAAALERMGVDSRALARYPGAAAAAYRARVSAGGTASTRRSTPGDTKARQSMFGPNADRLGS